MSTETQSTKEWQELRQQLKQLENLDPDEYEHPLDHHAMQVVERAPGLTPLVKKLDSLGLDRYCRLLYTGSYLRISRDNFPALYDALLTACNILDFTDIPDYYIKPDYTVNAHTTGVSRPLICVNTGCIDHLSHKEMLYILGHELGHIKSQHVMYRQITAQVSSLCVGFSPVSLGIAGLMDTGLSIALSAWMRNSEFTADRAGLLACQDLEAATTAMMKIAGVPPAHYNNISYQHFLEQAKEFDSIDTSLDTLWKTVLIANQDHPWTVLRAAELQKWMASGEYDSILARDSQQAARTKKTQDDHHDQLSKTGKRGALRKMGSRIKDVGEEIREHIPGHRDKDKPN